MEMGACYLLPLLALLVDSTYGGSVNATYFTAALACSDLHLKCSFTTNDTEEARTLEWLNVSGLPFYTMNFTTKQAIFHPGFPGFPFGISNNDNFTKGDIMFNKTAVTKEMAGDYKCRYHTNASKYEDTATVTVLNGPTSVGINKTSEVNTIEGSNLTLSCNPVGNPSAPIYAWSGPGVSSNAKVLTVTNVNRTNSGNYNCSVKSNLTSTNGNNCTISKSTSIQVEVYYNDIPTLKISDIRPKENARFVVTCQAVSDPPARVRLRSPISIGVNSTSVNTNIHVYTVHIGVYRCESYNSKTNSTRVSSRKTINVLWKPSGNSSPQSITAKLHRIVRFTITVFAYPLPNVTWFQRNSNDTLESVRPNAEPTSSTLNASLNASLKINITSPEDYGVYTLIAANSAGETTIANCTLPSNVTPFAIEEFQILNTSTDSIFMQWLSPFDGGNQQTFSFQFASERDHQRSIWSTRHALISDPGRYQNVTGGIFDLFPGRTYYIRIVCNNSRGSTLSTILNATTIGLPGDQNGSMASGVGIGFGICAIILLIVIIGWVVYHYKIKPMRNKGENSQIYANSDVIAKEEVKEMAKKRTSGNAYDNTNELCFSYVNSDVIAKEEVKEMAKKRTSGNAYDNTNELNVTQEEGVDNIAMSNASSNYERLERNEFDQRYYSTMALKPESFRRAHKKVKEEKERTESEYYNFNVDRTEVRRAHKKVKEEKERTESEYYNFNVDRTEGAESQYMNVEMK